MPSDFGFIDNGRLLYGWRRWLAFTFGQWKLARWVIGGRWELWWVDPCWAYVWHPVATWSEGKSRPCPFGSRPAARENYDAD